MYQKNELIELDNAGFEALTEDEIDEEGTEDGIE